MTIILYKTYSEPHRVTKTLSNPLEYTGTLKDSSSILNPVFVIENAANLADYNYCYIEEFKRYYFITGIDVLSYSLWAFSCHVDVLMTYASNIRSLSAVIARQENDYNLYLPDNKLLVESGKELNTIPFPYRVPSSSQGRSLIMTIAGGAKQN